LPASPVTILGSNGTIIGLFARQGDWQTFGSGGQARYKDAAIQTTLMVRTAFRLGLRQTEGLMASVITLMDLTISAPDHTTISRRAVTLPVVKPH
jgi:Transposase DDE domain